MEKNAVKQFYRMDAYCQRSIGIVNQSFYKAYYFIKEEPN